MIKTCIDCKEELPDTFFHKRSASKDGLQNKCKVCAIKSTRKYEKLRGYKLSPENARRALLKNRYGISPEDYDIKLKEQDGCCAICHKHQSEFNKRLAVDENHEFKFNRGLLCDNCNKGIGCFKEDKEFLQAAINYLIEWDM
jgi:hypothetical protein